MANSKMEPEDNEPLYIAAVEGGGTSFVVAIAETTLHTLKTSSIAFKKNTPKIIHRTEIDSSHDQPQKTLQECASFFKQHRPKQGYHALGIAMFGPVGLDRMSRPESYGRILSTSPKASWRNVDFLSPLVEVCQDKDRPLAVKIDTDVNAPALAEFMLEKDKGSSISSLAYITVGTGVGVGLVINEKPVHGLVHPEGGHVSIQPLPGDTFTGYSWGEKSPYKGHQTVESMTCSVALKERLEQKLGKSLSDRNCLVELDDDHEVWIHAANALANLCVTLILTTSVEKIVLGGGIMKRNGLIDKVRGQTDVLMNGYVELPSNMSELITLSNYGSNVGLVGAIVLAEQALMELNENAATKLTCEDVRQAKQEAFKVGLWHGILVGLSVAFIGFSILSRPRMNRR